MVRRAEGWTLRKDPRTGKWIVRFRHRGRRINRSTRTSDRTEAQKRAAKIYAEVTAGRVAPRRLTAPPLVELVALYLAGKQPQVAPETLDMLEMHWRVHLLPYFRRLERITAASVEDYTIARLREVKRSTVAKELSTLRGFVKWCRKRDVSDSLPEIPTPAPKAQGTKHKFGRRGRVELTPEQVEAILDALPVETSRGKYPAKAFFTVMVETALRYSTLAKIEAPRDYEAGGEHLLIRDEVDKARFGRRLPLSERAREALDSVCPDEGLIFGRMDLRVTLQSAARRAGLSEADALSLGYHDLRHHQSTELAEGGDLPSIAYLLGHKNVTTTARYVHAHERRAAEVLRDTVSRKGTRHPKSGHDGTPKTEKSSSKDPPVPDSKSGFFGSAGSSPASATKGDCEAADLAESARVPFGVPIGLCCPDCGADLHESKCVDCGLVARLG